MCKITPPEGWTSGADYTDIEGMNAIWNDAKMMPIEQEISKLGGSMVYNITVRETSSTFAEFVLRAERNSNYAMNQESRIQKFWRELGYNKKGDELPIYGSNIPGSLFRLESSFDLRDLDSLARNVERRVEGVTEPVLNFGSWRATTGMHLATLNMYSIHYLHMGAYQSWYSCPPSSRKGLESLIDSHFPGEVKQCKEYLMHKTKLLASSVLRNSGLPVFHFIQKPNEFVVTFPDAYSWGFSLGFNIVEKVNFGLDNWKSAGRRAGFCKCKQSRAQMDSSHIDYDEIEIGNRKAAIARKEEGNCRNEKRSVAESCSVWARLPLILACGQCNEHSTLSRKEAQDPSLRECISCGRFQHSHSWKFHDACKWCRNIATSKQNEKFTRSLSKKRAATGASPPPKHYTENI